MPDDDQKRGAQDADARAEGIERRFTAGGPAAGVELRKREDGKPVIAGVAAVYYDGSRDTEYELWPGVRERIQPGAFKRILGEGPDVRGLYNHDPNHVLGRTSKGTMTLRSTERGLEYEIEPPDTQGARDVMELLRRGDVDGSSFGFTIKSETRVEDGDETIYELADFGKLFDVGPVTFPAYEATSAGLRSMQTGRERPERRAPEPKETETQEEPPDPDAELRARAEALIRK